MLPVLAPPAAAPSIRPSRAGKWRTGVLLAVHLLIAAHIAHWLVAGETVTPVEPSEAMAYAKAGIVNAGLIFFATVILLTLLFGRGFCGWACHLVALQDGSLWILKKLGIRPKPLRSRLLRLVPAVAFLYMFIWPVAWRLWHGDRLGTRGTELTTAHFWATFPGWIVGALTFLVCGFVCVYFLGAKGFCTYACPYGAAFSWADRLSPFRVRVTDACQGCGHCTAVCTSNVRVHEEVRDHRMVVDPGCMKCGDCVSVCPNDALYLGFGRLPLFARPVGPQPETRRYPLSWSEELCLAALFLVAFFVYRGLHGMVPFLMSLGVAGSVAFLGLLGMRLATRPDFAFRHRALRRSGRLQPAGRWLLAGLVVLGLATVHSAVVHSQVALAERDFRHLSAWQRRALDLAGPAVPPDHDEMERLTRASARYERVARWGLVPWLGLDGRLAWTRYLRGDVTGFTTALADARDRGENVNGFALLEARTAMGVGDASRAARTLESALERTTDGVWVALARSAAEAGHLDAAAGLLERGKAHFPQSAPLSYNSGVVAALQGRLAEAVRDFQAALAIDPESREARENLAGMLASMGRFEESVALYRESVERAPGDLELRLLLSRALAAKGDAVAARDVLDQVLAQDPGNRAALELRQTLTVNEPNRR
ncbi:MAG: tetratricopeptide repeat protein [Thermoanaerobaculia bacterium]